MFTKIADSLKDPEDFGPPGFGSVNICMDPDPDSFSHQKRNVKKTFISSDF